MTRCEDCNRPIGLVRLRAVPDATTCGACQEARDYDDNLHGRGPLARARDRAYGALADAGECGLGEFLRSVQ